MKMRSTELSQHVEIAQQILCAIDTPRSLTISLMLKYEAYDDILKLRTTPENYLGSGSFRKDYAATRLLQKSKWLPTTIDRKAVALEKFYESEKSCKETNELIRSIFVRGQASFARPDLSALISRARSKITKVLSRFSPYDFLDHCGFGPGADFSTTRGFTSAYNKLDSHGSVTREASRWLDFLAQNSALGRLFQWEIATRSILCDRVSGNKVAFVPKDCKTDRTIAIEPRWNVFFQKGMGLVLRRALRYSGIDLDDQSINQGLAKAGSLTGYYATMDLQSASDTVSYELVKLLLPSDWVTVLDSLRSKCYFLNGKWHPSEKWSSMGNGYTFELESLLFFALAWSVAGDETSVYGDDIVIPSRHYSEVAELLSLCGFKVNQEKSFSEGPFRESCGGDYYLGDLVTPIYWKDPLNDKGTLRLVNQISVLAQRFSNGVNRHRKFRRVWHDLVRRVTPDFKLYGPPMIASAIHAPQGLWKVKPKIDGWDGVHIIVPLVKPQRFRFRNYDAAVLSQFFSPSSDGYTIRDRARVRKGTVFVPTGADIVGAWV